MVNSFFFFGVFPLSHDTASFVYMPELSLARGIAKASSAGFIASIAAHAKDLAEMKRNGSDGKDDTPTISVDYGQQ